MTLTAHATLVDNGDGTITDTDTGLMWLQDADYPATSGYDHDNSMGWSKAMTWAENLEYAGYNDWRLPTMEGLLPCYYPRDGVCNDSELGHLFYDELGNIEYGGTLNTGPFINLSPTYFWTSTEYGTNYAWVFRFTTGTGGGDAIASSKSSAYGAWAVRVVPEPVSSILFVTGVATLGFSRYWKSKRKRI